MAKDIAIIDTFMYNGEPIVELRLKYLYPYVTQFIIVEARKTHPGTDKPLFHEMLAHVFAPYRDKITFLVIDEFPAMPADWMEKHGKHFIRPGTERSWFCENYQRDYAQVYIKQNYEEYIAVVCDIDEIPSADVVASLRTRYFGLDLPTRFEMKHFYYNFGWKKPLAWYHAYCINDKGAGRDTFSEMRVGTSNLYIPNAGWHGSFFMSKAGMVHKIECMAHGEDNTPRNKSMANVMECLATGRDMFFRGDREDMSAFDVSFLPKPFQDFHAKIVFLQTYA